MTPPLPPVSYAHDDIVSDTDAVLFVCTNNTVAAVHGARLGTTDFFVLFTLHRHGQCTNLLVSCQFIPPGHIPLPTLSRSVTE